RADDLLDRLQRAAEQDARRKHGPDRDLPLDDEIRAEPEDERLHGKAEKAHKAGIARRAIARDDLSLDRPAAIAIPALQKAGHHAHRLNYLGIAQAHIREGVIARRGRARFGHRALNAPLAENSKRDERDRRDESEQPEIRMQNENDEDVDRRPGLIEDG